MICLSNTFVRHWSALNRLEKLRFSMENINSIQFFNLFYLFPSYNIVEHHIYIIRLHNINKKDNVRDVDASKNARREAGGTH